MESTTATAGHEAIDQDALVVHDWRVAQLVRLGIPALLAETAADHVDWHQVATLIQRGCPPLLALRIVR
jgi:predicted component of type VI protein secretion system